MVRHDLISDVMSAIKNAESSAKREVVVKASKLVEKILKVMQENGYIGAYEFIDDGKQGLFRIELKHKIIDCNAIRPRFPVGVDEIDKYEKRFLPAVGVGILILTTPKGVMDHKKAKKLNTGGRLLAYVY